jgi:hypothetical protein
MKLARLAYDPSRVMDFYQEGLAALGALCEPAWHDRLEIVADGRAATPWNPDGALYSGQLQFAAADATFARDAAREVFPGCPLTFRLAEALRTSPLPLERFVLATASEGRPPDAAVAEKLWRNQFSNVNGWRLTAPLQPTFHFSLVALARCEIQAIDQHWSLHRLVLGLPKGEPDEGLARELDFSPVNTAPPADISWPAADPTRWHALLRAALEADLAEEIASIRLRQENSLRRELDRIDDYFESYENELAARACSTRETTKLKTADRLAAARAEHARRRADQVARHEIRIHPNFDALLVIAEPAWRASLQVERNHQPQSTHAVLVPRARRWVLDD